jgi:ABC-2 type transport system ATP-binding protein
MEGGITQPVNNTTRTKSPVSPNDTEAENIIHIDHVTKIFSSRGKTVTAVNGISFDVRRGEIFGLLGPNGAGKSTLIRILTTLILPTKGTAVVDRFDVTVSPEKVRSIIGVCPQNSTLDVELTAYDNLAFYGKLVDVPDKMLDARIWELLEMTELTDRAHTRVGTFSGGMRRKLEIVRAFIHHPLILFLDEPTIGLDPEARREVWQQISALNKEETTIILTTHYMDEAEKLCNRIAFVDKGRLISLDTTENLRKLIPAGDLIEIGADAVNDAVLKELRENDTIISASFRDRILHISAQSGSTVLPVIVSLLEKHAVAMNSIAIRRPTLEDVFIYLTGKKLDDGENSTPAAGPGGERP